MSHSLILQSYVKNLCPCCIYGVLLHLGIITHSLNPNPTSPSYSHNTNQIHADEPNFL